MPQEPDKCITLPEIGCWEIAEGDVDSVQFINLLFEVFPETTTVYLEGTSIEPDVKAVFEKFVEGGPYIPKGQVIWPKSECFRCKFTKEFFGELSHLSENHAEPELFDHFFLYSEDTPLLEWPDAFSNCIWVSTLLSEKRVKEFSGKLGLPFRHIESG